jgi:hypothetical protein
LFVIGQLLFKLAKDKTAIFKFIFWGIFWGLALVFIWLPTGTLDSIGKFFGVGRGIDLLVYLSIIVLFYSVFRLNNRIDKLEKEITKLVRELAKRRITA